MSKCKICDAEEHPVWKAHVFKPIGHRMDTGKRIAQTGKLPRTRRKKRK